MYFHPVECLFLLLVGTMMRASLFSCFSTSYMALATPSSMFLALPAFEQAAWSTDVGAYLSNSILCLALAAPVLETPSLASISPSRFSIGVSRLTS